LGTGFSQLLRVLPYRRNESGLLSLWGLYTVKRFVYECAFVLWGNSPAVPLYQLGAELASCGRFEYMLVFCAEDFDE
jgi:hypothetical protein